jgi:hypothetical protein
MDDNTQKIASTETHKAEGTKVLEKKPAVARKKPTPKPGVAKPAVARKTVKKAAQPKKVEKKKQAKQKVVRDSFTMPEDEYRVLSEIKKRCLAGGIDVKKSELLRAGLQSLAGMTQAALKKQLSKLAEIKIGRPAKSSKGK